MNNNLDNSRRYYSKSVRGKLYIDLKDILNTVISINIDFRNDGATKVQKSRIYISGPITGIHDFNRKEFLKYENIFKDLDYEVINPHNITEGLDISKWEWQDFMAIDIPYLVLCDTIVVLDAWEKSEGAKLEIAIAYLLKKKILLAKDMQPLGYHFKIEKILNSLLL